MESSGRITTPESWFGSAMLVDALAKSRWNHYKAVLSMVSDGVKLNVLADGSNRLVVSPKRNIGAAVRSE